MAKASTTRRRSRRTASPLAGSSTPTRRNTPTTSDSIPETTGYDTKIGNEPDSSAASGTEDSESVARHSNLRRSESKGLLRSELDIDATSQNGSGGEQNDQVKSYQGLGSMPSAALEFDESSIEVSAEATITTGDNSSIGGGNGSSQLGSHSVEGSSNAVGESINDTDSAVGSWLSDDDTTSLSSSVLVLVDEAYRYENGRRYHAYKEGKWVMPNDEQEQDRMDFYHHIFLLRLDGELFLAPITEIPQKILDVGTGTGIWAIDMADKYPSAEVIGTDLSPIQPTWVPPNCRFEVDDCEEEWIHPLDSFDLIHIRNLAGGIKDWQLLFHRCYEHCKPGGYLEVQEVPSLFFTDDNSLPKGGGMSQMLSCFYAACEKAGLCFTNMEKLSGWMEDAGFVVEQRVYRMPIGMWPQDKKLKEIGKYMLANLLSSLESYCLALFTRYLGMTPADCKVILDSAAKEARRKDVHIYLPVYFIYGRKSQQGESS